MFGRPSIQASRSVDAQTRQYQTKQQSSSSYKAVAAFAFVGLAAVLLNGTDLQLSFPPTFRGQVQSLAQDVAALRGSQVQQQQRQHASATSQPTMSAAATQQDFQRLHELHNRPALALRNETGSYPEIHWPQHSGQQQQQHLQPPSEADLQLTSSEHANGSNPYMLVAYNGSFFGKRWPTHA
jgi:hypothetical protein